MSGESREEFGHDENEHGEDEHAGHAHRRMLQDDSDAAHADEHSEHDHDEHAHDEDHRADEAVARVLTVESLEALGEGPVNGAGESCWWTRCCATSSGGRLVAPDSGP